MSILEAPEVSEPETALKCEETAEAPEKNQLESTDPIETASTQVNEEPVKQIDAQGPSEENSQVPEVA